LTHSLTLPLSQTVAVAPADFAKFDDAYFVKTKAKAVKGSDGFFAAEGAKEPMSPARKADQKAVDSKLLTVIKKEEFLKPYLNARFSLSKGQAPHAMKF
ncbi:60S ribosomal protein L6E, partial [Baffinella frigidus]